MTKMARPPALAALAIALAVMGSSCGTCAFPFITSISPATATAGGSGFLLTINGDDFRHNSVVIWDGSFVVTTFVSTHQLLALIPAADIARPGTVAVFVFNPPEGGTFISGGIVIFTSQCSGRKSNAAFVTVGP